MTVAFFLFCFLLSLVTTLDSYVEGSSANRLVTQSAVSLFVDLPRDYEHKIRSVPGVSEVTKFQYFGGYYQDTSNYFAQFGIDPAVFFSMYSSDLQLLEVAGKNESEDHGKAVVRAMADERRSCVIGTGLVRDFGWKIGDLIPIIPTMFQKEDDSSWEFVVVGVYEATKSNVDERTLWFRYDYLSETMDANDAMGPTGVGTFAINLDADVDPPTVIAGIDSLFENGPQRTMTTTEAAFQAAFVSMMGNVPMFVAMIGGAVVFAVFFSVINTMLMAARQRRREAGILKALGYTDGALRRLMLGESLLLGLLGGSMGIFLAKGSEAGMRLGMATVLPNYAIEPATLLWAIALALFVGLVSGIAPALQLSRLNPTEAMRSEG